MKEVFVLLADGDGTMHSGNDPFGVAVTTEDEAKKFVDEGGFAYSHAYQKLVVFDSKDEALKWYLKLTQRTGTVYEKRN